MGFSPLTAHTVAHHDKYSARQGTPVRYLIVHHWAGTSGGDSRLLSPDQEVSASYILYTDGTLVGQVPEEYRPWTSGSWAADGPAVTVETQNSANGGVWPVSDASVEKLAQLAADLCHRYKWGRLDRSRVRGHREFASTACPGDYLWARLDHIIQRGNQILAGNTSTIQEDDMTPEQANQLKTIHDAIFRGGNSMRDGKRSISQSLADIAGAVRREVVRTVDGKQRRILQIQDNADTNTMVRTLLAEQAALRSAISALSVASGADPEAIQSAAEAGARAALDRLVLTASTADAEE